MESKAELQEKIRQIEQQISELQAACDRLTAEQEKYEQKIAEIEKEENTTALLNSIFEITDENAQYECLYQDTRTTPIMDQFYHSDKRFLVFTQAFYLGALLSRVSLVIVKSRRDVNYDIMDW